jgi:hypothetical protein
VAGVGLPTRLRLDRNGGPEPEAGAAVTDWLAELGVVACADLAFPQIGSFAMTLGISSPLWPCAHVTPSTFMDGSKRRGDHSRTGSESKVAG